MKPAQIPYGVKDFKRIRLEDRYFVDKSMFIERFDAFAWDGDWKGFLNWLAEKYRDNGSPRDGIHGEARR